MKPGARSMRKFTFQAPSRIPQLYFGATSERRRGSRREKLADALFLTLWAASYLLFIAGGIAGYLTSRFYGMILFTVLGYGIGIWMRRSLGLRGRKATTGFFTRMRERAQGAKPGLLEWLIEKVGGTPFTQARCRAVVEAQERAVRQLKRLDTPAEQNKVLAELDRRVRSILSAEDNRPNRG